jgi:hypothetical protein
MKKKAYHNPCNYIEIMLKVQQRAVSTVHISDMEEFQRFKDEAAKWIEEKTKTIKYARS